jgi:hypothetical protein
MFRKSIYFVALTFLSFFLFTFSAHALDAKYVPLASIPLPNASGNVGASGNLGSYFSEMYQLGVGIATALAVLMVIWGGVEYVTTDAIGGKEEGRQKVQNAILGLLLALGSYLILKTINPALLNTNLDIKSNNPQDSVGNYFPALPSGSAPSTGNNSTDPWYGWNQTKQDNLNAAWDAMNAGTSFNDLTPDQQAAYNESMVDWNKQQIINNPTSASVSGKQITTFGGQEDVGHGITQNEPGSVSNQPLASYNPYTDFYSAYPLQDQASALGLPVYASSGSSQAVEAANKDLANYYLAFNNGNGKVVYTDIIDRGPGNPNASFDTSKATLNALGNSSNVSVYLVTKSGNHVGVQ